MSTVHHTNEGHRSRQTMSDEFDSMTRSTDDDFHAWAMEDDYIIEDVDVYEACDRAWAEAKSQSASTISELEAAIRKHKAGFEEPDFGTVEDKELWAALTKEEL